MYVSISYDFPISISFLHNPPRIQAYGWYLLLTLKKSVNRAQKGFPRSKSSFCVTARSTLSAGFSEIHNGLSYTSRSLILVPDRFCTKPIIPLSLFLMTTVQICLCCSESATRRTLIQLGFSGKCFYPAQPVITILTGGGMAFPRVLRVRDCT